MLALRERWGFGQTDIVPGNHTQVSNVESGLSQLQSHRLLSQYGKAFQLPAETIVAYANGEIDLDDLESRITVPKRTGNKRGTKSGSMRDVKRADGFTRAIAVAEDIAKDGRFAYPHALAAVVEVRDPGGELAWRRAALEILESNASPPPRTPPPPDFRGRGARPLAPRRNS